MKKFTSLFALLSCLCVVSAQAADPVTIYVYTSNPDNQALHWWDGSIQNASPNWDNSPLIKTLGVKEGLFYKIQITPNEGKSSVNIILKDNSGSNSGNIEGITGENNYYYYFGGSNYQHFTSFELYISGTFSNPTWQGQLLTNEGSGKWSYELTASSQVQFKIVPNNVLWLGYDQFLSSNPYSGFLFRYDGGTSDNNIILEPLPGINKYFLTIDINNLSMSINGDVLALNDNAEFNTSANLNTFTVGTATYSRTCSNQWGSLCLPFEFSADQDDVTFYEMSNIELGENGAITFSPITGVVPAGQPVAFKLDSEEGGDLTISNNDANGVSVVNEANTFGPVNNSWYMKGTFTNTSASNIYIIQSNGIRYASSAFNLKPYRAWFTGNGNGAPLRIEVADTEGLQYVEQEDGTVKAYYDLQGRKLDGARKGLVIENGKIIMVK